MKSSIVLFVFLSLVSCQKKSELLEIPKDLKFHHVAVGCEHCYHTGYAGRKAIYEILPIGSELSNLIKNNQLDINEYLEENNIITLKRNALLLIKEGTTSVDEVFSLLL